MRGLKVSPVVLSAASSVAIVIAFAIVRAASPELSFPGLVRSRWIKVFMVECASVFPLFFLTMKVRGARWLWLVWLIAAADYSASGLRVVWQSYPSALVTGVYIAWTVKIVVLAMLFVPRPSSGTIHGPNRAPEPTPGSVAPSEVESRAQKRQRTCLDVSRAPAFVAPRL